VRIHVPSSEIYFYVRSVKRRRFRLLDSFQKDATNARVTHGTMDSAGAGGQCIRATRTPAISGAVPIDAARLRLNRGTHDAEAHTDCKQIGDCTREGGGRPSSRFGSGAKYRA
jgi:hypothetical protein